MDPTCALSRGDPAGPYTLAMDPGSLYRRRLPDAQVSLASPAGRRLFREALDAGHMEGFLALAEQFHTQSEPAFCGLGTLVMVLNALAIDPGRPWKGVWRWFSEDMLDCCEPLEQIEAHGITLPRLACIARCNGAHTEMTRAEESTEDAFREAIAASTTRPGEPHLVVSYSRRVLGQTGDGHFSPIGGYHPAEDLTLVLDVARFKYPPHWVPTPLLWSAMAPADAATGRSRGWLVLGRGEPLASCFRISFGEGRWRGITDRARTALGRAETPEQVAGAFGHAIALTEMRPGADCERTTVVFDILRGTEAYRVASAQLPAEDAEQAALLALVWPMDDVSDHVATVLAGWRQALPHPLAAEVEGLRRQLRGLTTG